MNFIYINDLFGNLNEITDSNIFEKNPSNGSL